MHLTDWKLPTLAMSVISLQEVNEVLLLVRRGSCLQKLDVFFILLAIRAVRQWVPILPPI